MSATCSICQRGSAAGYSRSHSKRQSLRRFSINLQWKRVGTERLRICTSCLKTVRKLRTRAA